MFPRQVVFLIGLRYHIPGSLTQHIDYITPGIKLASYGFDDRANKRAKRGERRRSYGSIQSDIAGSDIVQTDSGPLPIAYTTGGCDRFVTAKCIRGIPDPKVSVFEISNRPQNYTTYPKKRTSRQCK